MFILETTSFPQTIDQLTSALNNSLRKWIKRPGDPMASVSGEFPSLSSVSIDASGGTVDVDRSPPDVRAATPIVSGPSVARLTVVGKPVRARGAAVALELSAVDVTFGYAHNAAGQAMLVLQEARDGQLKIQINRRDLESAILEAARLAAEPSGIAVQRVEASLSTPTPRQLDVDLTISAKKFVTAVVRVRGRATVDDRLNATLSNLSAQGDGMVARLAVGLIQGQLQKLEGQQFSLLAFSLGNVRLRDVSLNASEGLAVAAVFGG